MKKQAPPHDNKVHKQSLIFPLLLLFGLSLPGFAWALSSDREKPLHISADQGSLDDLQHRLVYQGNVVVTQGTLRIEASKVTLQYAADKTIQHIIAEGQPATYRELQDGDQQELKAEARYMKYEAQTELLHLRGQAVVWQGADKLSGEQIRYDAKKRLINAEGNQSGQIQVTIQPKPQ